VTRACEENRNCDNGNFSTENFKIKTSDVKSSRTSCPRGQNFVLGLGIGLEHFVLGMSSNFLSWPRENECNDGTDNHCEFAMIIYQSCLLTYLVLLI